MSGFNLLDDAWIPCRMLNGSAGELGIGESLLRAHEVAEIFDPSPLVTGSLHRLLLAVVQAAFGTPSVEAWREHWRRRSWDPEPLRRYLAAQRENFDLFHPVRPFFQIPPDEDAELHPVVRIAQERASGNNATLFDHTTHTDAPAMTAAEAGRYLVALQAYALGGGKSSPFYFSDGSLARGFSVMVEGANLFETLVLNWGVGRHFSKASVDRPAWEWTSTRMPNQSGTSPAGFADYLTWQSRRVRLIRDPDDANRVTRCQVEQYLSLPKKSPVLDPFKCYRRDQKRGITPRGLSENRALWRDSTALFQWQDKSWKRPDVFDWLAEMRDEVGARYSLAVYGVATAPNKAASVLLWRHERLPLPLRYLSDDGLVAALAQELGRAESIGGLLQPGSGIVKLPNGKKTARPAQILGETLAKTSERQPTREVVNRILEALQLDRGYWARLELPFRRFLLALPDDEGVDEDGQVCFGRAVAGPAWHRAIRTAALDAFRERTQGLECTASNRGWKAIAQAEIALLDCIGHLLPNPDHEVNAA